MFGENNNNVKLNLIVLSDFSRSVIMNVHALYLICNTYEVAISENCQIDNVIDVNNNFSTWNSWAPAYLLKSSFE